MVDLGEETDPDMDELDALTNRYALQLGLSEYGKYLIPYFSYTDGPLLKKVSAETTDSII